MRNCQIVIDTNVWVSALRSKQGASYRLFSIIDDPRFKVNVSVPLIWEYEEAALRLLGKIPLTERDIDDLLDYLCRISHHREIFYLWRPFLSDPDDDMILELAVAAECDYIITYNARDFLGSRRFGIHTLTPGEFLRKIGAFT